MRPKFAGLCAVLFAVIAGLGWAGSFVSAQQDADPLEQDVTQGALRAKTPAGTVVECPLKHTAVKADVSGFIARVKVTQTFFNPYNEKIEAVYVFPLPHTAAVDDMTMVIGERRVVGIIKRRAEARALYEQALQQGLTASLLEQERPNIFTQSVGNIAPHQEIRIEISYVDVLKYDMGTYEFQFPMVVGPRYIPGAPISQKPAVPAELKGKVGEVNAPTQGPAPTGTGWAPDTDRVPDASRITPPVLKPGFRTGHDISLTVKVDAGVPVHEVKIPNHQARMERGTATQIFAALDPADSIPNKDFVLRYTVVGPKPELAVLANAPAAGDGYFMLMMQPRLDDSLAKAPPREIVFLIDVSGSMSGAPTEKVKQTLNEFFALSKPDDTIQVVTFAGSANKLFDRPVPATRDNVAQALRFTDTIRGGGGTEMLKGIKLVLAEPVDPQRVRIVVMLTDGYIGNEAQIIEEVGRRAGDQIRFWCLGIGSSPNQFLVDGVAKQGGGMSAVIGLNTDPTETVRQIVERIHRAQLAKIQINWGGLSVFETYPRRIPELWAGRPVILFGRYQQAGTARVILSGTAEGKPLSYSLAVSLPAVAPEHEVLAKVWARNKIEDLSAQMFYGDDPVLAEEITQVALAYRLMSQYTSFVAVDERDQAQLTEPARPPRRVLVAVPLPEGVSYAGVFGEEPSEESIDAYFVRRDFDALRGIAKADGGRVVGGKMVARRSMALQKYSGGIGGGYGSGIGGGRGGGMPLPASSPSPAPLARPAFAGTPGKTKEVKRAPVVMNAVAALSTLGDVSDFDDGATTRFGWAAAMFQQSAGQRHEAARKAFVEAEELQKKGELEQARLRFQYALLLEKAFLAVNPWSNDGTAAKATDALEKLSQDIGQARTKQCPALATRVDLVLRPQPVADALRAIAKAAGLKFDIVPGSLEDAGAVLGVPEVRVNYLDLRRATVAQALEWLLGPVHLTWQITGTDTITVGSARRLPGSAAWVYSVGDLAVPTQKELGDKDQPQKFQAALKEFEESLRRELGQKDDAVLLLSPSLLFVSGDAALHAKTAALLTALADPKATTGLAALQKLTAARWADRADERQKRATAQARQRTLAALDRYSWQLLAATSCGETDDEALTELQVASSSSQFKELLTGPRAWVAMRSAWAMHRSGNTGTIAREHLPVCLKALRDRPDDIPAQLDAVYTMLILQTARVESDRKELQSALTKNWKDAPVRLVAATLFEPSAESDAALIAALTGGQLSGDDLIALAGLAAQQRGGSVCQTFREELPHLTGSQPLNGHAVVYANRLAAMPLGKRS